MSELPEPGGGGMERRAILATILAVVVLLVYQAFFMPTPPPPPPEREKEVVEEAKPTPPPPRVARAPQPRAKAPQIAGPLKRGKVEEEISLETDLLKVTLTNRGAGVRSWQLKRYQYPKPQADLVDLVGSLPNEAAVLPIAAWVDGGEGSSGLYRVVERPVSDPNQPQRVVMEFQEAEGVVLQKAITLQPGRYLVDVELRLSNLGGEVADRSLRVQWGPGFRLGARDQGVASVAPVALIDGKPVWPDMDKVEQELTQSGAVGWTALQDRYFAAALIPVEPGPSSFVAKDGEGRPVVGLLYPSVRVPPGGEATVGLKLYAGPKEVARLREVGKNLQAIVDLGWFDFLARPALYFLRFLYDFTGNYGVAIVIITILQKVGFLPLAQKSHKSMQAMQALQPKIQAIKDRHKNNPQKANQETMDLYKRHGVNPLGGCLPMLIQIPIFIALYNALASSVELWQAPFALWINDLSAPDTLFEFPFPIPFLGEAFPFRGLPLIMGVSMFIQQKMSPTGGDPRQAKMMLYLMPVMFTFIFWGMPSGLVLYWLINNVLQIGHQYQMNRGFGLSLGEAKTQEEA